MRRTLGGQLDFGVDAHEAGQEFLEAEEDYKGDIAADIAELTRDVSKGKISSEDYLEILSDIEYRADMPVIRYEHAPGQYVEIKHPCSHFHVGHQPHSRWAISRVLTPLSFSLLVLKHYYPQYWLRGDDDGHLRNEYDRSLAADKRNCRQLGNHHFNENERSIFFFD